jgi:hypothetical protein
MWDVGSEMRQSDRCPSHLFCLRRPLVPCLAVVIFMKLEALDAAGRWPCCLLYAIARFSYD